MPNPQPANQQHDATAAASSGQQKTGGSKPDPLDGPTTGFIRQSLREIPDSPYSASARVMFNEICQMGGATEENFERLVDLFRKRLSTEAQNAVKEVKSPADEETKLMGILELGNISSSVHSEMRSLYSAGDLHRHDPYPYGQPEKYLPDPSSGKQKADVYKNERDRLEEIFERAGRVAKARIIRDFVLAEFSKQSAGDHEGKKRKVAVRGQDA